MQVVSRMKIDELDGSCIIKVAKERVSEVMALGDIEEFRDLHPCMSGHLSQLLSTSTSGWQSRFWSFCFTAGNFIEQENGLPDQVKSSFILTRLRSLQCIDDLLHHKKAMLDLPSYGGCRNCGIYFLGIRDK